MNRSQITVDLTDATDSFTVEAIIYNGGRSIRRFQTIPVVKKENRYDVFFYIFGTKLGQMEEWIDSQNTMNTVILKAAVDVNRFSPFDFLGFTQFP